MKVKQTILAIAVMSLVAAPAFADRDEDIDFMITCVTAKVNGVKNLIDLKRSPDPALIESIEMLEQTPFMRELVGRIVDDPANIEETAYPQYRPMIRSCLRQLNTV